jgi:hypothetical protein
MGDFGVVGLQGLPCDGWRCRKFGAFVINLGGFLLEYSGGEPVGISGGGGSGLVDFCCDLRSSCAITAAYSLSISSCRFTLSASTTAASKLITLKPAGDTGLLMPPPLRMLLAELFFALSLRGEYQLRLLMGLMGLGSKALLIGLTISVLLASAARSKALFRRVRPTVNSRTPMMRMLAM